MLPALAGLGLLGKPPAPAAALSAASHRMRALHRDFAAQALTHEQALGLICPDFARRDPGARKPLQIKEENHAEV